MVLEKDFVFAIIKSAIAPQGYELVELQQDNEAALLSISVHKHDGGIAHNDCVLITRLIEEAMLEQSVPIRELYRLEVASAGIDRKLKSVYEMEIFTGYQVSLVYQDTEKVEVQGRLVSVSSDGVQIEKADGSMLELDHKSVKKIRLSC